MESRRIGGGSRVFPERAARRSDPRKRYVLALILAFLTLAPIVLFTALRTKLTLSRTESSLLLALYGVFVGWMVLETLGVTRVVF